MVAQLTPPESEFAALPDPSPGMLAAARAYDVAAVRAIADWFREQDGGEAAAASCALLAFDLEVELVRARQVREMLDQVRPLPPMSRPTEHRVELLLRGHGIPCRVTPGPVHPDGPASSWCCRRTAGRRRGRPRG
ncbi:MAG TPA: hypothetical protein VKE74_24570 [Gemmataceae bacterium]|nr:hypothetical protein [Gemmataceae bacterium]